MTAPQSIMLCPICMRMVVLQIVADGNKRKLRTWACEGCGASGCDDVTGDVKEFAQ